MKSGRLRKSEAPALGPDLRALIDALPFPAHPGLYQVIRA